MLVFHAGGIGTSAYNNELPTDCPLAATWHEHGYGDMYRLVSMLMCACKAT